MTTSKGGRPRKPTALRLIEGGKMPETEPRPTPAKVRMPAGLSRPEQRYWRQTAPDLIARGVLTRWDVTALKDWCIYRARKDAADKDIAVRGQLVLGREGTTVRNPSIMISQQAGAAAARIGARFGLTPSDRAGVVARAPSHHDHAPGTVPERRFHDQANWDGTDWLCGGEGVCRWDWSA